MRVLSVDQVTAYITELFDSDPILVDVWIRGEISHFTEARSGHCYFSLTDGDSTLRCVLFRGNRTGVPVLPAVGDRVAAHGRVGVYQARGEYQLYVDALAGEGLGLLQLEFERMRARLETEGLFRPERKRQLPDFPRVIGVVTSREGAVWHDIQDVVARRFPATELLLSPSSVQGAAAPAELVRALELLWHDGRSDVIIIGRGGGSPEDLAAFNDENLARAIFASPIPIVSAVGHETDVTIADLVADVRAPTPSSAGEIVVPYRRAIEETLAATLNAARSRILERLDGLGDQVTTQQHRLAHLSPQTEIDARRMRLDDLLDRSRREAVQDLQVGRDHLDHQSERLRLLDPRSMFERGYVMTLTADGKSRIRTADEARRQRRIALVYRDDTVPVRVEDESA